MLRSGRSGSLFSRAMLFVWELPQNMLGASVLALSALCKQIVSVELERERFFIETRALGISLGMFVFYTRHDNRYVPVGEENRAHEYGHAVQSRMLGPLYLPIVGATSELRVAFAIAYRHLVGERWSGYYEGFPENWADDLGGADKTLRPPP